MDKTIEMTNSYLIQRVRKPITHENWGAFGGGYKNGGLSDDAFKMLKKIFSFDYMGAAEYEFGAVPQYFKDLISNHKETRTWETSINKTPVYVVGAIGMQREINDRLTQIAKGKAGYIKCGCDLGQAVGLDKYSPKDRCGTVGWLEMSNNFAFFTDKEVFENFCNLFEFPLKPSK